MADRDLVDKHADHLRPRLGVSLTGAGFRATFFHVGVLAQLARLGLLRQVEVLSTVSGGSLVGVLYYLHLKNLLESRSDSGIEDADYVGVMRAVERDLLGGAARNVAALSLRSLGRNVRMIRSAYSRSDRVGELYDELFIRPAWDASTFGPPAPRLYDGPIQMRELIVRPAGAPHDFHPLRDNATRAAKVPVLLITATTLNTGHLWRFEASRMGEPPQAEDAPESRAFMDLDTPDELVEDLDRNMRLRPVRTYDELGVHQVLSVGHAVAASSAVPGLLPPLAVTGLYPGIQVQLVDGSLSDPHGVQGLLDFGCRRFVVSNGGRGLSDIDAPSTAATDLHSRAAAIVLERLRSAELSRLRRVARIGSAAPALLHLRKGLSTTAVPWISSEGVADVPARERTPAVSCEDFDVDPAVQEALSRVRTAFGSFTEVEASSLMLDGYQMSRAELAHLGEGDDGAVDASWDFERFRPLLKKPTPEYLRQLRLASTRTGRLRIDPVFRFAVTIGAAVLGVAAVGAIVMFVEPWLLAVAMACVALAYIAATRSARTMFGRTVTKLIRGVALFVGAFVAPLAVMLLRLVDRVAARVGAAERLLERKEHQPVEPADEPAKPAAAHPTRDPKALVFVLASTAFAVGCLPLALRVGHLPLVGYLAVVAALASWLSLRRMSLPTDGAPSRGEVALAWPAAIFSGAVLSFFSLVFYEAIGFALMLIGLLVRAAGGGYQPDTDAGGVTIAAIAFSLPIGYALATQSVLGLAGKLYPGLAGGRSVFSGLAAGRGWLIALGYVGGTAVLGGLVAASFLFSGWSGWSAWGLEFFLLGATAWLWEQGESVAPANAGAVSSLSKVLTSAGFDVRTDLSPGGAEVSPLVQGVDLLATGHDRTLAIEVKTGTSSEQLLDWTAASSLRIAASALVGEVGEPGSTDVGEISVEPVLVLVGVDGDESLEAFAEQLDVTLVRFADETALAPGGKGDADPRANLERALNLSVAVQEGDGNGAR